MGSLVLRVTSLIVLLFAGTLTVAQNATLSAHVVVKHAGGQRHSAADNSNVVLWLELLDSHAPPVPPSVKGTHFQLIQKDKQFHPHVLVVPVGASVEFPNLDPFFHNVFSLYKGKRFDLGLYEAGSSRAVRFDHSGVSFVFCNIHSHMSAYVIAVNTPYFGTTDAHGQVTISDIPVGRYRLQVWYERASSNELAKLSREVSVTAPGVSVDTIEVVESEHFVPPHPNKHGEAYEPERVPY